MPAAQSQIAWECEVYGGCRYDAAGNIVFVPHRDVNGAPIVLSEPKPEERDWLSALGILALAAAAIGLIVARRDER